MSGIVVTPTEFTSQQLGREFDPKLLELQMSYIFNPNLWIEDIIGPAWEPDRWQTQGMDELVHDRFLALSTGTGPGKTAFCAIATLYFLSTRPFPKVLCTAPTQPQLKRALWPEIGKWLRHSNSLDQTFEWTQTRVSMRGQHANEWFAEAKTARPQSKQFSVESLQGLHADNILIIVDEASGVPDQVMNAIDGCVTTKGAHVILAGNPVRRRGYFFVTISDQRQRIENGGTWRVHNVSVLDSKHVDHKALERNIQLYGKESDYYRVKVLGLPPLADSQGLISPEQVFDMHAREPIKKGMCVISCDPSRYGDDYSVIYVRKGWTFVERAEVYGMNGKQVGKVVLDLFDKCDPDHVCIDSIGIGASVYDFVEEGLKERECSNCIMAVEVGSAAINDDKFLNLRAEIFWMLPQYVKRASIPMETDRLDEELPAFTYHWNKTDTRIQILSKDELRAVLHRSPNDGDAFALSFYPNILKDAVKMVDADVEYFRAGSTNNRSSYALKAKQENEKRKNFDSSGEDEDEVVDITQFLTPYAKREDRLSGIQTPSQTVRGRFGNAFRKSFHV